MNLRTLISGVLIGFLLMAPVAEATCGGGGGGGLGGISGDDAGTREVYRVPWKVLEEGLPDGDLKLLWMPGSAIEARTSDLLESRYLTLMAGQCVGFALLPPKHPTRIALAPNGSTVVVTDGAGLEIARLAGGERELEPGAVEKLLRGELAKRKEGLEGRLEAAAAQQKRGDADGAATAFEGVWAERCLFPSLAKRAAKALDKLGRPVDERSAVERPAPDLEAATGAAVEREIRAGLAAESALALDEARVRYENATRFDSNDPVALRYLAEFHRHHSGDWGEARRLFGRVLELGADPVSRAVALHGLGKMTLHAGDFARGLELFEQSLAAWPLPLTYRNLAVYWFSEQQFARAQGYMEKALALAPDDPYNRIFAAVYLAGMGKPEEARKIALESQGMVEASYNLAAIWAQLGDREKTLELLARHFYSYERYEAVRAREMQEARDDYVFAALHRDPAFVELTRDAIRDLDSYHRGAEAGRE
jgi:tetratricopeptide (TPR) repeat protein